MDYVNIKIDDISIIYIIVSAIIAISCCGLALYKEKKYPGGFSPCLILILFFAFYACAGSGFIERKHDNYLEYFTLTHGSLVAMTAALYVKDWLFSTKFKNIDWDKKPIINSSNLTFIFVILIFIVVYIQIISSPIYFKNASSALKSIFTFSSFTEYGDLRKTYAMNKSYIFYYLSRGIFPVCATFLIVNFYSKKKYLWLALSIFISFIPFTVSLQKSPFALFSAIIFFSFVVIKKKKLNVFKLTGVFLIALIIPIIITIIACPKQLDASIIINAYIRRLVFVNPTVIYASVTEAANHYQYWGGVSFANLYRLLGFDYNNTISQIMYDKLNGSSMGHSANSSFISNLYWDFRLIISILVSFIISFCIKWYTDYLVYQKRKTVFTIALYSVLSVTVVKFCFSSLGTVLVSEGYLSNLLLGIILK
ncbi:MAG: O-antigen ligase [Candidatus Gastranaerophilales bacterium]|nr:O-antigen ligase [Candidatus Gastranaerophilales bacterium]